MYLGVKPIQKVSSDHEPVQSEPKSLIRNQMSLVMRKPVFAYAKTKMQISFAVVQSLYFLNPKFQAASYLLWLYRLDCVGPGRKPRRPIFSQRGSNKKIIPTFHWTTFPLRSWRSRSFSKIIPNRSRSVDSHTIWGLHASSMFPLRFCYAAAALLTIRLRCHCASATIPLRQ